jgi:hypothetical protein
VLPFEQPAHASVHWEGLLPIEIGRPASRDLASEATEACEAPQLGVVDRRNPKGHQRRFKRKSRAASRAPRPGESRGAGRAGDGGKTGASPLPFPTSRRSRCFRSGTCRETRSRNISPTAWGLSLFSDQIPPKKIHFQVADFREVSEHPPTASQSVTGAVWRR